MCHFYVPFLALINDAVSGILLMLDMRLHGGGFEITSPRARTVYTILVLAYYSWLNQ
jgi:hypothetical protein